MRERVFTEVGTFSWRVPFQNRNFQGKVWLNLKMMTNIRVIPWMVYSMDWENTLSQMGQYTKVIFIVERCGDRGLSPIQQEVRYRVMRVR